MTDDWNDIFLLTPSWDAADLGSMGRDWSHTHHSPDWASVITDIIVDLGPKVIDHFTHDHPAEPDQVALEVSADRQNARDDLLSHHLAGQLHTIDHLTPEGWHTATTEERAHALFEAARHYDDHLDTPTPVVIADRPPGTMGEFEPLTGTITVSADLLTRDHPRDAVRTLLHELRHAHQHDMVALGQRTGFDPSLVDAATTQRWAAEFRAYRTDALTYKNLGVEADAELFAVRITDALYRT